MEARNPLWFFGHEECVERKKVCMFLLTRGGFAFESKMPY
jgi:hypothetical protein